MPLIDGLIVFPCVAMLTANKLICCADSKVRRTKGITLEKRMFVNG